MCPPRACEVRLELRSAGSNWSWRGTVALRLRPLAPAEQKPALRIGVCAVALDAAPPAEAWRAVADARAHRRDGRPAEALQASEAGLLVAPRWPPLVRERAEALLALGWFAPAASALSGLAKEAPHDTQLQLLLRGIERCLDAAQRAEAERRPGDAAVAAAPTTPSRGMLALSSAMLAPGGDADEGSISARLRRFRDEASKGIDSISDLALEAAAERRDKALAAAALAKAMAEAAIDEARDAPSSAAAAEASGDGRSFVDDIAQRFGAALRPRRSSGASGSGAELLRARSVSMGDGGGGGGARRWSADYASMDLPRTTADLPPPPDADLPPPNASHVATLGSLQGNPTPPPLRARARSAAAAAETWTRCREAEEGDDDDPARVAHVAGVAHLVGLVGGLAAPHVAEGAAGAPRDGRRAAGDDARDAPPRRRARLRPRDRARRRRRERRRLPLRARDGGAPPHPPRRVDARARRRRGDARGAAAPPLLAALADLLRAELELELGGASLADARELLHLLATLEATLAQHGVPPERSALLDAHAVQAAFRAWLHEQRANFEQVLDGSFAQESWAPLTATQRVSASVVDLFQCFTQTVDFFFAVAQPSVSMARYLDWLLQEVVRAVLAYAERIQRRCGDADALLGPVDGALAARLAALTPPALCTMLNNVVSAAAMLEGVWANVDAGWRRAVGEGGLNRRALEDALGLLRGRARTLTTFVARRLVAYQLGDALGAALYARGVREPEQQMAALLPELAEGEAELVGLVLPEHAEPMAFEVLRAALGAFERVLLGGRVYSQRDGEALADDLADAAAVVGRATAHQRPLRQLNARQSRRQRRRPAAAREGRARRRPRARARRPLRPLGAGGVRAPPGRHWHPASVDLQEPLRGRRRRARRDARLLLRRRRRRQPVRRGQQRQPLWRRRQRREGTNPFDEAAAAPAPAAEAAAEEEGEPPERCADDLRRVLQRRTEPEAKLYLKLLEERETGAENGAARPAEERKANPSAVLRKMKTTSGGALSMLGKALSSSGKSERGSGA